VCGGTRRDLPPIVQATGRTSNATTTPLALHEVAGHIDAIACRFGRPDKPTANAKRSPRTSSRPHLQPAAPRPPLVAGWSLVNGAVRQHSAFQTDNMMLPDNESKACALGGVAACHVAFDSGSYRYDSLLHVRRNLHTSSRVHTPLTRTPFSVKRATSLSDA
jgi:hypothetical protein